MEGQYPNDQPIIIEQNKNDQPKLAIKVKLLSNQVFDFQINPHMIVLDFKKYIADKIKVPVEKQRLVFGGKQLLDTGKVSDYVKQSGVTVHVIAKTISQTQPQRQNQQENGQNNTNQQGQNTQNNNQPRPPQQQQIPVPNLFSMMGNLFGPPSNISSDQANQINAIGQSVNNLMGNLGIRVVGPIQVNQQNQGNQPNQGNQINQNNQTQNNQPRPQTTNQPGQNLQRGQTQNQVVSLNALSNLQGSISRLNLPPEQFINNDQLGVREQTALYLRRLQNQMLRFIPQLSRGIQMMAQGRVQHLTQFLPIFQALNQSNTVAIQAINRVLQQSQQQQHQHVHGPNCNHGPQQQPNTQSANISATIVVGEGERMDIQVVQQAQSIPNFANIFGGSGLNLNNIMGLFNLPNQQPNQQQNQQPNQQQNQQSNQQQNQQSNQQPNQQPNQQSNQQQNQQPNQQSTNQQPTVQNQGLPSGLGGMDMGSILNVLQSNGGVGQVLSMSLGDMLEEQGTPPTIYSCLLKPFAGQDMMGIFMNKNFTFLHTKKAQIKLAVVTAEKLEGSREAMISKITEDLCDILIPKEGLQDPLRLKNEVSTSLKIHLNKLFDRLCDDSAGGQEYVKDVIEKLKLVMCTSIEKVVNHTRNPQQVFLNSREVVIRRLETVVPGLGGMFYSIVEKDLIRIYKQYMQEQHRLRSRSEQEAKNEGELMQMIEREGLIDSELMGEMKHHQSYYPK